MDRLIDFAAAQKSKCIGLVFRCQHSSFPTKNGYGSQTRMNLLKRLSCPGCEQCGGDRECLDEMACDGEIGLVNLDDGSLYTLKFSGSSGPDQNGEWDPPEVEFIKWSPPTLKVAEVIQGQRVLYIPDHAKGDPTDKRCEKGVIKRWADSISERDLPACFVLYDNLDTKMITGDEPYTAKRTRLENLTPIDDQEKASAK